MFLSHIRQNLVNSRTSFGFINVLVAGETKGEKVAVTAAPFGLVGHLGPCCKRAASSLREALEATYNSRVGAEEFLDGVAREARMDQRSISILRLGESDTKRLLDAGLCTVDQLRAAVEDRSLRKVKGFGGRNGLDTVTNALSRLDSEDGRGPNGEKLTVQAASAAAPTVVQNQEVHLHPPAASTPPSDADPYEGPKNRRAWIVVGLLTLVGSLILAVATLGAPAVNWMLARLDKAAEKAEKVVDKPDSRPPRPPVVAPEFVPSTQISAAHTTSAKGSVVLTSNPR